MSLAWFKTKLLSLFGLFLVSFLLIGCGSSGGGGSSSSNGNGNGTTVGNGNPDLKLTSFTFNTGVIGSITINATSVDITIDENFGSEAPTPTVTHTGVDYSPRGAINFADLPQIYTIIDANNNTRKYQVIVRRALKVSNVDDFTTAIYRINEAIATANKSANKSANYFTILVQKDINLTGVNTRNITTDWAGNNIIIEKDNSALPNNITITGLTVEGINTVEFIGVKTAPATSTNNQLKDFTFPYGVIKNATINGTNVDITIDYYSNYTTPIVTHNGLYYYPNSTAIDFTNLPTPYTIRADDNTPKNYHVTVRRAIEVSNEAALASTIDKITNDNLTYITILINNDINLTRANNITIPSTWKGKNIVLENNSNLSDVTIRGLTVEGDDTVGVIGVNIERVITAVTAGQFHSFAIDYDGKLWATGDNSYGQLGLDNISYSRGTSNSGSNPNSDNNTGEDSNGGTNFNTTNGNNTSHGGGDTSHRDQASFFQHVRISGLAPDAKIVSIAAGEGHSLALDSDGKLWATGWNDDGQLGLGNVSNQTLFQHVTIAGLAPNATIVSISAGRYHSIALDSDGKIWVTGANWQGQLGFGNYNSRTSFFQPATISNLTSNTTIISIAAGGDHSLALTSDGRVLSTQCIYTQCEFQPVTISGLAPNAKVVSIAAGHWHSFALDNNSKIWATRDNGDGQLGLGNQVDQNEFQAVTSGSISSANIVSIATYARHSLALTSDGKIWATGYNNAGELGLGNYDEIKTSFQAVTSGSILNANITSIAAGLYHSLALDSDGKIWAAGQNAFGESGLDDSDHHNVFTPVSVSF